jgi:hypothetical protein
VQFTEQCYVSTNRQASDLAHLLIETRTFTTPSSPRTLADALTVRVQKWQERKSARAQERKSGEKAKRETRVSTGDPHARAMHQPDGGLALGYNAQISTDATYGLIVGVAVTQEPNDSGQLLPAVDRVEQRLEKKPQQMVADSGYTTRENIEKMAGREID